MCTVKWEPSSITPVSESLWNTTRPLGRSIALPCWCRARCHVHGSFEGVHDVYGEMRPVIYHSCLWEFLKRGIIWCTARTLEFSQTFEKSKIWSTFLMILFVLKTSFSAFANVLESWKWVYNVFQYYSSTFWPSKRCKIAFEIMIFLFFKRLNSVCAYGSASGNYEAKKISKKSIEQNHEFSKIMKKSGSEAEGIRRRWRVIITSRPPIPSPTVQINSGSIWEPTQMCSWQSEGRDVEIMVSNHVLRWTPSEKKTRPSSAIFAQNHRFWTNIDIHSFILARRRRTFWIFHTSTTIFALCWWIYWKFPQNPWRFLHDDFF